MMAKAFARTPAGEQPEIFGDPCGRFQPGEFGFVRLPYFRDRKVEFLCQRLDGSKVARTFVRVIDIDMFIHGTLHCTPYVVS